MARRSTAVRYDEGTVFRLTRRRYGQVLHSFRKGTKDGYEPGDAELALDRKGNIYGETTIGGLQLYGVAFELSPRGRGYHETILWNFDYFDGAGPSAGVILDRAGDVYGTAGGGRTGNGIVFELTP
jgi:hypothetical protein